MMRSRAAAISAWAGPLRRALIGFIVLLACTLGGSGQTSPPAEDQLSGSSPSPATLTLHVYAAHMQMPTLVLDSRLRPIPRLNSERFEIRLDNGPPFAPSAVRLEGDDPITLAVLFDAGGEQNTLLPHLSPALVRLRTADLRPQDTLIFFAVDCSTVRYSGPLAQDAAGVQHAVEAVLEAPALHAGKGRSACRDSLRLWDTMLTMASALSRQPGRHVLLALTTGEDRKSKNSWNAIRPIASWGSTAIFAVSALGSGPPPGSENPLGNLCSLTGGLLFSQAKPADLPGRMDALIDLLRSRYILEFPRSNHLASGVHDIDVHVPHEHALVRTTGVSATLLDQKTRDDPNTVPYLEADRPQAGSRRVLTPGGPP